MNTTKVWVITAQVPRTEGIKVIVCGSPKSADEWASDILQKVIDQMDIADRIDMTPRAHVPVTAASWESRLGDVQDRLGAGRCWIQVLEHTVIEGGPGAEQRAREYLGASKYLNSNHKKDDRDGNDYV